jgi:hypothetical protein
MTDEPISLTLCANADELMDIGDRICKEVTDSGWLRWRSTVAFWVGPVAAAALAAILGENAAEAAVLGFVAVAATTLTAALGQDLVNRRFRDYRRASAMRQLPTMATLAPDGFRFEAKTFPWTSFPEFRHTQGATLLMFSPVDALVIRDVDLADGLTPDALRARIEAWKGK